MLVVVTLARSCITQWRLSTPRSGSRHLHCGRPPGDERRGKDAPLPDLISWPKAGHSEAGYESPVPAPPWAPGRLVREPLVQEWEGARRGIDPKEGTETLPTFAFRDAELQQVLRPLGEVPLHLCVVSPKRAD